MQWEVEFWVTTWVINESQLQEGEQQSCPEREMSGQLDSHTTEARLVCSSYSGHDPKAAQQSDCCMN